MSDQNPTITPYDPTGSVFLDRVTLEAFGVDDYDKLPSARQTVVQAVVKEKFSYVYNRLVRLVYGDDNALGEVMPSEFQSLFAEESIFGAIRAIKGFKAAEEQRGMDEIERLWNNITSNYSPASPTSSSTTSKAAIDRYITAMTLRLKDRVLIPSHQIDDHIQTAWTYIWNWDKWPFRRREGTFTIETNGTLTATGEIATFGVDQLATRYFYYTSPVGAVCRWVTPDQLSEKRAEYGSDTGRPQWFRMEDSWVSGSPHSKSVIFVPQPDQTYTVNAAALVKAPPLSATRTSTYEFDALPPEFHPILWDMVAGRILQQFDRGEKGGDMGSAYRRQAEKMLENFANEFADQGQPGTDMKPTDSMGVLGDLPTIGYGGVL